MTNPKLATAREEIIGWINKAKLLDIPVEDVTFSKPIPYTGPNPPWHVKVTVTPNANTMWIGKHTHNYDRIHISELGVIIVNKGDALRLNDLLPQISEVCGVKFDVDDLIDYELDGSTSGNIVVDLQANPDSLMYYDGPKIYTPNSPEILPGDPNAPVYPEVGVVLSEYCKGGSKWAAKADGAGGYTLEEVTPNSPSCGYVDADLPKISSFAHTTPKVVNEGQYVEFVYTFNKKPVTSLYFDIDVTFAGTMTIADIESVEVKFTGGDWMPVKDLSFGIPRNKFGFTVRMKVSKDIELLPEQDFSVNLLIAQRSELDVEPGDFGAFDVTVSRSVYESTLTLTTQNRVFYEGTTNIIVYSLDQPIVENTTIELTIELDSVSQKPLTSIGYRTAVSNTSQPLVLDSNNKAVVPMSVGVKSLIIELGVAFDAGSVYQKGVTISTKELWATRSVLIDEGVSTTHFSVKTPT